MGTLHSNWVLLRITRQIPKERVRIETCCLCFKMMHVDWDDIEITGISGIEVKCPQLLKNQFSQIMTSQT